MDYKELLVNLIGNTDNEHVLQLVYSFLLLALEDAVFESALEDWVSSFASAIA